MGFFIGCLYMRVKKCFRLRTRHQCRTFRGRRTTAISPLLLHNQNDYYFSIGGSIVKSSKTVLVAIVKPLHDEDNGKSRFLIYHRVPFSY
jgi:hypothetical protein